MMSILLNPVVTLLNVHVSSQLIYQLLQQSVVRYTAATLLNGLLSLLTLASPTPDSHQMCPTLI